LNKKYI